MAWARYCKADLSIMGSALRWRDRKKVGEELLCYAIGELVRQVVRVCHVSRVWE
jgi:hypothetical protein